MSLWRAEIDLYLNLCKLGLLLLERRVNVIVADEADPTVEVDWTDEAEKTDEADGLYKFLSILFLLSSASTFGP